MTLDSAAIKQVTLVLLLSYNLSQRFGDDYDDGGADDDDDDGGDHADDNDDEDDDDNNKWHAGPSSCTR